MTSPDYIVYMTDDIASDWMVCPQNGAAIQHLDKVGSQFGSWLSDKVVVKHRSIGRAVEDLARAGFRVQVH